MLNQQKIKKTILNQTNKIREARQMSQKDYDMVPRWYVVHTYSGYENKEIGRASCRERV